MLDVVKLSEATRGFVLLPRRCMVERSFAWMTRFRMLAKDLERRPKIRAGLPPRYLRASCSRAALPSVHRTL
jgi:transposase